MLPRKRQCGAVTRYQATLKDCTPFNYEKVFRQILVNCTNSLCDLTQPKISDHAFSNREATMINSLSDMIIHFAKDAPDSMSIFECLLIRKLDGLWCDECDWEYCSEDEPREFLYNFHHRMEDAFDKMCISSSDVIIKKEYQKVIIHCLLLAVNLLVGLHFHKFTFVHECVGRDENVEYPITFDDVFNEFWKMMQRKKIPEMLTNICLFGKMGKITVELVVELTETAEEDSYRRKSV